MCKCVDRQKDRPGQLTSYVGIPVKATHTTGCLKELKTVPTCTFAHVWTWACEEHLLGEEYSTCPATRGCFGVQGTRGCICGIPLPNFWRTPLPLGQAAPIRLPRRADAGNAPRRHTGRGGGTGLQSTLVGSTCTCSARAVSHRPSFTNVGGSAGCTSPPLRLSQHCPIRAGAFRCTCSYGPSGREKVLHLRTTHTTGVSCSCALPNEVWTERGPGLIGQNNVTCDGVDTCAAYVRMIEENKPSFDPMGRLITCMTPKYSLIVCNKRHHVLPNGLHP